MNVVMLDPTESIEHRASAIIKSLKGEVGELYELSFKPEARDAMIKDLGKLSDICLALNLIWSRVKAREES